MKWTTSNNNTMCHYKLIRQGGKTAKQKQSWFVKHWRCTDTVDRAQRQSFNDTGTQWACSLSTKSNNEKAVKRPHGLSGPMMHSHFLSADTRGRVCSNEGGKLSLRVTRCSSRHKNWTHGKANNNTFQPPYFFKSWFIFQLKDNCFTKFCHFLPNVNMNQS